MIAILQPLIPHYREEFFNQLSEKVACDIYVYDDQNKNRNKNLKLSSVNTKSIKKMLALGILIYSVRSLLQKKYSTLVLMSNIGHLSTWFLLFTKRFHGKKIILWGHGISVKRYMDEEQKPSRFMKLMLKNADALWFYTEKEAALWRTYLPQKKMVSLNNTISDLDKIKLTDTQDKKEELKKEFGVKQPVVFIYCARFENKYRRPDLLEKVIQTLNTDKFGFIIIGAGVYKPDFSRYLNVYDFGSVYDQELKNKLFGMADAYFQPAWCGLSVVEAMAYGKAILTLNRSKSIKQCVEYHYIQNDFNGYVFNSPDEAVRSINGLKTDQLLELGSNGRNYITSVLTIENMVENACSVLFNPIEIIHDEKINLYFWQNCISPHQVPYIKELHKGKRVGEVYLIAPVRDLSERKSMGWEQIQHDIEGVQLIIAPDNNQVLELFKKSRRQDIHLFSGTRAFKEVYNYFRKSLSFDIKRGIITESPFRYKIPLWIHQLRFLLLDNRYVSKIDFVFAIGDSAVKYYQKWYDKWKVIPFVYCVEENKRIFAEVTGNCKLIYVGGLIHRKNVSLLLESLTNVTGDFQLDIVGDGAEKERLENFVYSNNLSNKIKFEGKKNMNEIPALLATHDILVLPSLHDGWGAVINEALQNGLYVICSNQCGGKILIENSQRGLIFKNRDIRNLTKSVSSVILDIDKIRSQKTERIQWSERIGGTSISQYMVECLIGDRKIIPPWKRQDI